METLIALNLLLVMGICVFVVGDIVLELIANWIRVL